MSDRIFYYRLPDGSLVQRTVTEDGGPIVDPSPPEGGVPITAAVYATLLAALQRATQQLLDDLAHAEQVQASEDYTALTTAGIPPATAARLAGYTGVVLPAVDEAGTATGGAS